MFLTSPTIDELQALELPSLMDMLAQQTSLYIRLINEEGASFKSNACKEVILNIQTAIETKKNSEKKASLSSPGINFSQAKTPSSKGN